MKLFTHTCLALLLTGLVTRAATQEDFQDTKKRLGYGLGANYGKLLQQNELDVDLDMFIQGVRDYLAGTPAMDTTAMDAATKEVNEMARENRRLRMEREAEENTQIGAAFLEENKSKEGVVTLPSGLQYQVVTEGTGSIPTASDRVRVHYRGTFINGEEFDSSYKRNAPAEFNVTGVIRGWTEALQLMKVGSKWNLFIPSDLAYGKNGSRSIPPNSTLLFEVELMDIVEPPAPKPAAKASAPITSDIIKVPSAEELKKGAKIEVIKKDEVDEYIKKDKETKESDK